MKLNCRPGAFLLCILLIASCSKENDNADPGSGPDPIDTARVKLKELTVTNLPSPYYHFVYNDSGYATQINFASGFHRFTPEYQGKRLVKMMNTVNLDFLLYHYSNNNVTAVDVYSGITGLRRYHYDLLYNTKSQLTRYDWYILNGNATDSVLERRVEMEYGTDGNLALYRTSRTDDDGNLNLTSTTRFHDYDTKTNVEDFQLLKEFFEYLVYLPQVKFQKNNPRSMEMSSTANDFEISFGYTYNTKGWPVQKKTTVRKTRGDNSGSVSTSQTTYTYY